MQIFIIYSFYQLSNQHFISHYWDNASTWHIWICYSTIIDLSVLSPIPVWLFSYPISWNCYEMPALVIWWQRAKIMCCRVFQCSSNSFKQVDVTVNLFCLVSLCYHRYWGFKNFLSSDSLSAPAPPSILHRVQHILLTAYYSNRIFTNLVKPTSWPISPLVC